MLTKGEFDEEEDTICTGNKAMQNSLRDLWKVFAFDNQYG